MNFKPTLILVVAWSLILLLVGCEVPELTFEERALGPGGPRSNFVPPQASLRANVGEPLLIESRHTSRNSKLATVSIFVNGQPLPAEETAGQATFPEYLGKVEVLGWPAQSEGSEFLILPLSSCRRLSGMGEARPKNPVELEFRSASWSLCHLWIGQTPGTYDLSLRATDRNGNAGQMITQRIEVE